jgi:hypothetical protein
MKFCWFSTSFSLFYFAVVVYDDATEQSWLGIRGVLEWKIDIKLTQLPSELKRITVHKNCIKLSLCLPARKTRSTAAIIFSLRIILRFCSRSILTTTEWWSNVDLWLCNERHINHRCWQVCYTTGNEAEKNKQTCVTNKFDSLSYQ